MTEVDIIIPVYKPQKDFAQVLQKLLAQTYPIHRIILMNTEQKYWDAFIYDNPGLRLPDKVRIYHLSKWEFDHGKTRREGVKKSETPYFVMMTQDAMPENDQLLEQLLTPLLEGKAQVSYARQLPREGAGAVESFTRSFNYPEKSCLKSKADKDRLGIKTYFCSNVCAAYNREVYNQLGGFIRQAIFNEDMVYAADAIEAGYKIAYVAQARVIHSHAYSNRQQFHRNFDVGVSQAEHPEVFKAVSSESEGIKLVKQTADYLKSQGKSSEILPMIVTSGYKWLGYQLGKRYEKLPKKMVLKCTMNRRYFEKNK